MRPIPKALSTWLVLSITSIAIASAQTQAPPLQSLPDDPLLREKRLTRSRLFNVPGGRNLDESSAPRPVTIFNMPAKPEMPVKESSTVVTGYVSDASVFLAEDRRALYTEYS